MISNGLTPPQSNVSTFITEVRAPKSKHAYLSLQHVAAKAKTVHLLQQRLLMHAVLAVPFCDS
jgi:hypothetical protein